MRRSACVPLPTPGAPTRMMRAALLISLDGIVELRIAKVKGFRRSREADWRAGTFSLSRKRSLKLRKGRFTDP